MRNIPDTKQNSAGIITKARDTFQTKPIRLTDQW